MVRELAYALYVWVPESVLVAMGLGLGQSLQEKLVGDRELLGIPIGLFSSRLGGVLDEERVGFWSEQ